MEKTIIIENVAKRIAFIEKGYSKAIKILKKNFKNAEFDGKIFSLIGKADYISVSMTVYGVYINCSTKLYNNFKIWHNAKELNKELKIIKKVAKHLSWKQKNNKGVTKNA